MAELKLKLKSGTIEIEYEGSQEFLEKNLLMIIENIPRSSPTLLDRSSHQPESEAQNSPNNAALAVSSTNTIASKINCKTGIDLVVAACAKIQLVDGSTTCDRKKILEEMKSASAFYKGNMSKNLSSILISLIKSGILHESGRGQYSLSHEKQKELESQLSI